MAEHEAWVLIQQHISERNKSGSAFLLELSICKLYEEILIRLYEELSKLYLSTED